jgi:hypothetical protein
MGAHMYGSVLDKKIFPRKEQKSMYKKKYSEDALASVGPAFEDLNEAEMNLDGGGSGQGSVWGSTIDSISAYPMRIVSASMNLIHASVQTIHKSLQFVHNEVIGTVIHDNIFEPFIPGTGKYSK